MSEEDKEQRCGNCRFFYDPNGENEFEHQLTTCRRFPKVVVPCRLEPISRSGTFTDAKTAWMPIDSAYPEVSQFDWCGEWKEVAK